MEGFNYVRKTARSGFIDKIRRTLLDYRRKLRIGGYSDDQNINKFLSKNDFALLVFLILNSGQDVRRAWEFPFYLSRELGGDFNADRIAGLTLPELDRYFIKVKDSESGVRFWRTGSAAVLRAAYKLKDDYGGEVSKIWDVIDSPPELMKRFEAFYEIGQKKASFVINMLIGLKRINFPVPALRRTQVSNDKHVRQVLLRSGVFDDLVIKGIRDKRRSKAFSLAIVEVGRRLNEDNPGDIDLPLWDIGRVYCFNKRPNCKDCVLTNACEKKIRLKG